MSVKRVVFVTVAVVVAGVVLFGRPGKGPNDPIAIAAAPKPAEQLQAVGTTQGSLPIPVAAPQTPPSAPDLYLQVTESIVRMAEQPPAPRLQGQKAPVYKRSDLGLMDDEKRFANTILAGINKLARENPDCAYLSSFTAHVHGEPPWALSPTFSVQCKNADGEWLIVKFTAQDLKKPARIAVPLPIQATEARNRCAMEVSRRRPDVSTVRAFQPWTSEVRAGGRVYVWNTIWLVSDRAETTKYLAGCWFTGQQIDEVMLDRQ